VPVSLRTRLLHKYLFSFADQGFVSASLFLATFALARNTHPSDFGPFAVARDAVLFVIMMQVVIVTRPLTVFRNTLSVRERQAYTASSAALQYWFIALSLLVVAGWLLVAVPGLSFFFAAAVLFFCGTSQCREYRRFLHFSDLRLDRATALSGLYLLGVLLVVGALAALHALSPLRTILGLGAASLVAWLVDLRWYGQAPSLAPGIALQRNLAFSFWEMIGSFGNFVYVGAIPLVLGMVGRLDEAGGYGAARNLLGPIQVAVFGVYNVLVPQNTALADANIQVAVRHSVLMGGLMWFTSLAVVIPLVAFGGSAMATLYNPSYERFGSSLGMLGLYSVMMVPTAVFHSLLLALGQPRLKALSQLCGMIVGATLLFLHRHELDARLAAFATMASEIAVAGVAGLIVALTVCAGRAQKSLEPRAGTTDG
jgi:O-antigen/teichoic acid export membrane protein